MNKIAEEIKSYLGISKMSDEEYLMHVGRSKKDGAPGPGSGRYPLGSGEDPYQHDLDFIDRIESMKKKGWVENTENIKKEFNMSTSEYRRQKSIAVDSRRMALVAKAKQLYAQGMNKTEIAKEMGIGDTKVGYWLRNENISKMNKTRETARFLKKHVDEKKMIDVGEGVENEIHVSREKLDTALEVLKREGYVVLGGRVPQLLNKNHQTTLKVLCTPGTPKNAVYDYDKIKTITDYESHDGGLTFDKKFTYPASMDSKRLAIRYAEDGGKLKDGVVELRRGVPDLSLGNSIYSQVRILVDGKRYVKGMAVYGDDKDFPPGVDAIFNTNKTKDIPKMEVLKKIKDDPENPFGSNIKDADQGGQYWYDDKTGKKWDPEHPVGHKKLGLINKRSDEDDWSEWKDTLPSQFLSKQSKYMAKKQLDLARLTKESEFSEIMSLNNPTVRKYYLNKFADECDAAAVDLKAAALPGQKYHVILPSLTIGDDKIYAPRYPDGTKLALVRYPHGGIFEIPVLTVDNKNKECQKIIGKSPQDAVMISSKTAEQLSGADFDGDTVMCIPTDDSRGRVHISRKKPLAALQTFDNKLEYGPDRDKTFTDSKGVTHYFRAGREYDIMKDTQKQMGVISNLISDMNLIGATDDEQARAVKHSMVVIDAEKHKLDYKQSYKDNNIDALKRKYQIKYDKDGNPIGYGGASTIISRAKSQTEVVKRKGQPIINIKGKPGYDPKRPEGALIYKNATGSELYYAVATYDKEKGTKTVKLTDGKTLTYNYKDPKEYAKYNPTLRKNSKGEYEYTSPDGRFKYETAFRTDHSTKMADTDDAYSLVSKNKWTMELLYADYANSMKDLANRSRIAYSKCDKLEYNKEAAKIYSKEIKDLENDLDNAVKNKPRERYVTLKTYVEVNNKMANDSSLKPGDIKKLAQRATTKYRQEFDSVPRRKRNIKITDKQWEAIQAGAISDTKLKRILDNSDPDILRARAMPKEGIKINSAQIARMRAMQKSNFTLSQIADKMNVSPSTVAKYLKGDE